MEQQQPQPRSARITVHQQQIPTQTNTHNHQLIEPASMPSGDAVVDSLELEDSTTMTGGTSWTLRVPWLRSRRLAAAARRRQDDENSSIQSAATNSDSNRLSKAGGGLVPEDEPMYYGGLMKTTTGQESHDDPIFNHENHPHTSGATITPSESLLSSTEAGSVSVAGPDVMEASTPRILQQQRQPQRQKAIQQQHEHQQHQQKPHKQRKRRLLDGRRKSSNPMANAPETSLSSSHLPSHHQHPTNQNHYVLSDHQSHTAATTMNYNILPTLMEHSNTNRVFRNRSWLSYSSARGSDRGKRKPGAHFEEEDSLADFDETEWTPQDSAYGAAIPVCGWIPKKLRQVIEATLIAFIVFILVYLVVKTSITVSEGKSSESSSRNDTSSNSVSAYDNGLQVDDDWYVENTQYQIDDDDYFNNNGDGDVGNGNR